MFRDYSVLVQNFAMSSSATTHPPLGGDVGRGHVLNITSKVTGFIAIFAVALRMLAKVKTTKVVSWDDWVLVLALVCLLVVLNLKYIGINICDQTNQEEQRLERKKVD